MLAFAEKNQREVKISRGSFCVSMKVQWTQISLTPFNCESRILFSTARFCMLSKNSLTIATQSIKEMAQAQASKKRSMWSKLRKNLISLVQTIKSKSDRGPRVKTSKSLFVWAREFLRKYQFFSLFHSASKTSQGPPLRYYTLFSFRDCVFSHLPIVLGVGNENKEREKRKANYL